MSVTGLQGRDQGGGHQSQESKGLRLCPESNEDSLKGFKQLNDRVIRTFRQINPVAVWERDGRGD